MHRTPRRTALAALAAAALLLPGCYFATRAIPLDPSGMEYPVHVFREGFREQVSLTGERIEGFPEALADHCRTCWSNLTEEPGIF